MDNRGKMFEVFCGESMGTSTDCIKEAEKICPLGHQILTFDRVDNYQNNPRSDLKIKATFQCK